MRQAPYAEHLDDDILDIRLNDAPIARTRNLGHWRNIDLDEHGRVVAAEFINVETAGVDLDGVPERDTVERLIREAGMQLPTGALRSRLHPARRALLRARQLTTWGSGTGS